MTPADFIRTATYRRGSIFDGIRYRPDRKNVDCDDFAITLLAHLEGGLIPAIKALARGDAELWRVKSPTNVRNGDHARHVALYWRAKGTKGGRDWIDSTNRRWRQTAAPHDPVHRMRLITVLPSIAWGFPLGKIIIAGAVLWPGLSLFVGA